MLQPRCDLRCSANAHCWKPEQMKAMIGNLYSRPHLGRGAGLMLPALLSMRKQHRIEHWIAPGMVCLHPLLMPIRHLKDNVTVLCVPIPNSRQNGCNLTGAWCIISSATKISCRHRHREVWDADILSQTCHKAFGCAPASLSKAHQLFQRRP